MKDNVNGTALSPEFIQQLKAKNDIVTVISKCVHLEKKGKNFWGCCPFHHEKTPSFCINEYDGFYHCFGCGESGDVITFLRKYEDLSYIEAVRILAENAHMEIPHFEDEEKFIKAKRQKERSIAILNLTKDFYKQMLLTAVAAPAQNYLKKRKITRGALEDFELGYSPNFNDLPNFLQEKGFSAEEIKFAGVCEINKNSKPYDFLFERLAFPVVNTMGDCIGFSGRDLSGSGLMKYKNTSATMLFDKSKTVYGINLIKKLKQLEGIKNIIIVEGQFDVISMHEAGFNNTVACMGTALTKDHIRELRRFSDNIILCFDGDDAGQKAILRAFDTFENFGEDMDVRAVRLPNKADPDEFLKEFGAEKLRKLMDVAVNSVLFKINNIKEKYDLQNSEQKVKFTKSALGIIAQIKSSSEQDIYLSEIKNLTGLSLELLRRDLQNMKNLKPQQLLSKNLGQAISVGPEGNTQKFNEISGEDAVGAQSAIIKAERFVVGALLHRKQYAVFKQQIYDCLQNPSLKNLYEIINEKHKKNEEFMISCVWDYFKVESEPNIQAVINLNFEISEKPEEYYAECENLIINEALKFKKDMLSKQYSIETLPQKRLEILTEINKITKTISNLEKQRNKR